MYILSRKQMDKHNLKFLCKEQLGHQDPPYHSPVMLNHDTCSLHPLSMSRTLPGELKLEVSGQGREFFLPGIKRQTLEIWALKKKKPSTKSLKLITRWR